MTTASPHRVVEALSRFTQRPETGAGQQTSRLSIAITRQAGSRGPEIAAAVGLRLGWPVYDHELMKVIAEMRGIHARRLEKYDERCPSWMSEVLAGLSPQPTFTEGNYMRLLTDTITVLGKTGHCVIVGRGAVRVLPPENTLRVRIVAPHLHRVMHVRDRMKVTMAEAERWVDQTDVARAAFLDAHFNVEPEDPLLYDLVINSGTLSTDQCADLIVQGAKTREGPRFGA